MRDIAGDSEPPTKSSSKKKKKKKEEVDIPSPYPDVEGIWKKNVIAKSQKESNVTVEY